MRKRTAKTLLLWFAKLPQELQATITEDALRRRHRDENNSRRRGERPDNATVGERQFSALLEAIASKRALLDGRQKNKNVPAIEKLMADIKNIRQLPPSPRTEFIAEHLNEFVHLRSRGMSFRALREYISKQYGVAVSLGILHTALKELAPHDLL